MRTELEDLVEHLERYRAVTLQVLEIGLFSADEVSDLPTASWLPIVLKDAWTQRRAAES